MMVVRLVLTATLFLLVLGNSTSQLRDELVATTKDLRSVDKAYGGNARIRRHLLRGIEEGKDETLDHRQGRTAFNTESPASKAKREQVFRNRLAVRRRQALTRSSISPKTHLNSTLKSNNSLDMLEVQETRHSVYVTAPSDDPVVIDDEDEEAPESKDSRNSSVKNGSLSSQRHPKSDDQSLSSQMRHKNTVVMPESLYNHFRPVESNIPIEDMTQFRYFGQKIRPETTTSNNSVEVTSTSSPMQRRRFFIKGFSTTAIPSSKLEEMINEEMNIAVDKTVERNKISKTKNVLRGTSLYLRKAQQIKLEPLTVLNVRTKNESKEERGNSNSSTQIPEGNDFESETADSNDVTTLSSLDSQADESMTSKFEKPKSVRSKKTVIPRPVADSSTAKTEENGLMSSESSPQVLGRISTWLSINADPMTPSIDRENGGTSSLRIVVTEPAVSRIVRLDTVTTGNSSRLEAVNIVTENAVTSLLPSTSTSPSILTATSILTTTPTPTPTTTTTVDSLTSATSITNKEAPVALAQQMHPYAYTITNVTRLLGNYSGPGSNDNPSLTTLKEQVNSWFSSPTSSGMDLQSTRTPGPVSVAPTAVEYSATTPVIESSPLTTATPLVGEPKDTTLQQQVAAVHRNTSAEATVQSTTDVIDAFNYTEQTTTFFEESTIIKELSFDKVSSNERKLLLTTESGTVFDKKEGSVERKGVLKSTTTESAVVFDKKEGNFDRKGLLKSTTPQSAVVFDKKEGNFDLKGFLKLTTPESGTVLDKLGANVERKGVLKSTTPESVVLETKEVTNERKLFRATTTESVIDKEVNERRPLKLTTESGVFDKKEVSDRRFLRKSVSAVLNQRSEESIRDFKRRRSGSRSSSKGRMDERVGSRSIDGKDEVIEAVDSNSPNNSSMININSTMGKLGVNSSMPVINDEKSKVIDGDKFEGSDKLNLTESRMIKGDNGTNTSDRVIGSDEFKVTSTTAKTPVFPVTPMVLEGANKVVEEKIEVEGAKAPDRPFGIAKDLDPSEIQKMYRSQTTLKPEGTTLPEANLVTSQPKMEEKKPGERSPEVRGRNLSDKTKDKDDVLPIMHLYNTSDIFNGTMKDLEDRTVQVGAKSVTVSIERENRTVTDPKDPKNGNDNANVKGSKNREQTQNSTTKWQNSTPAPAGNRTRHRPNFFSGPEPNGYHQLNGSFYEPGIIPVTMHDPINMSEVITKRHDGDTLATQETVVIVSYILAGLVFFPIVVGVVLIFRRLIIKNRKVLEESDTSSEISCRKDALNLENGDFKTSIEKAITKLPRIQHLCHEAEKPPPSAKQESRWEFPRDKLRLQTVLGQGNFGQVWKAEADDLTGHKGTTRLVAVKTVKEGASAREKEDLVRELEIMQQLGNHPNVVTLLGCCTEEEPHYLILEYVMYGKLLAYLRDHRTRQDFYNFSEDSAALTSRDLTVFGYCVARGMEYLASKKIIHRDLAARNVLVDHNKLCKIADFGMSRFANEDGECIETRHGRNALPIRWMAPESLIYSLFTTKTDVWSFGILMWEIVTLGSTPYPDMAAREVMRSVQDGYRLERPSHCRSELFRVIARCWHADPDRRPEFQLLRRDLAKLLEDNMNGHYVDLESYASECTD